jgi:hypothetical protein
VGVVVTGGVSCLPRWGPTPPSSPLTTQAPRRAQKDAVTALHLDATPIAGGLPQTTLLDATPPGEGTIHIDWEDQYLRELCAQRPPVLS